MRKLMTTLIIGTTIAVANIVAAETLVEWDFVNKKYTVPVYDQKNPVQYTDLGVETKKDSFLNSSLAKTTVAAAMDKPFTVKANFIIKEIPVGYMSGVFQMFEYQKKGLRIAVKKDLTVVAEINVAEEPIVRGLTSKSKLPLNEEVAIELKFNGKTATLLINGQEDVSVDMPYPQPYNSYVSIGNAGGKDYHFVGTIKSISITQD